MAGKSTGFPPNLPPELRRALETIKESVDQGEGNRGDPLLRNLKVKDLLDLGMAQLIGNRAQKIVSGGNLQATTPAESTDTPPAPSGISVNAGVFHILISWDPPFELYGNHAYTEVFRNTVDNRSTAVMVAQADGFMWPDLDVSYGTTYYYWIRFVSTADVTGPFNTANGTPGAVSQSPQELLDRLNGEITETQLFADLNSRINLIDGPADLDGSVNQRVVSVVSATFGKNLDFEAGLTGWTHNDTSSWLIENNPTRARRGNWVLKCTRTTAGQNDNLHRFPATEGDKFVAGCWVDASSATGGRAYVNIRWEKQDGTLAGKSTGSAIVDGGAGWQQSRVVAIAPAGAARGHVSVIVTSDGAQAPAGTWYIDDVTAVPVARDTDIGVVPDTVSASVTEVDEAIANASGASATSITQLSTQHGDNTSTIQVHASSIDGLEGQYSVKIDVNGQVAGYGLSNTANEYDDTVHSTMLFSVDTFAIGSPGATDLSFIVDNGQVVIDAAYIVNLVVEDADIVSLDVGKVTGLSVEVQTIVANNIIVDELEGDVNSIVTSSSTAARGLPEADLAVYREMLSISLPAQTRPRIPMIFSKLGLSVDNTADYNVGVIAIPLSDAPGAYNNMDTDANLTATGRSMTWQRTSETDVPAFWSTIDPGEEIALNNGSNWYYGRVSGKIDGSNGGGWFFQVDFSWGIFSGGITGMLGVTGFDNIQHRGGSTRKYDFTNFESSGQLQFRASPGTTNEYNHYILSLSRSDAARDYILCLSADTPNNVVCESIRSDTVMMR